VFRRLLSGAVAVVPTGLAAADRVTATVVAGLVADRIRTQEALPTSPTVTIGGFPFLTQALCGTYSDVRVTVAELRRGSVALTDLTAHLHGVRVPLANVLRGSVRDVPVDDADAKALLTYADLTAALPAERLSLSEQDGRVRLHGSVMVFGQRLAGSAVGEVRVEGNRLTIIPHNITLDVGPTSLALGPAYAAALTYSTTLTLPFGLRLGEVAIQPDGLRLSASGQGLVLGR